MTYVAITQRVEIVTDRGERRDALDQRWHIFLDACGLRALPLPNHPSSAQALLAKMKPCGIILSGGNDLARFGGHVPERDATESACLAFASSQHIPVLGVCRGMQFLADAEGIPPVPLHGHAGVRHIIHIEGGNPREVNSYHRYGILTPPSGWRARAKAEDGSIEQMAHLEKRWHGVMWHPEREITPDTEDIHLFREIFL